MGLSRGSLPPITFRSQLIFFIHRHNINTSNMFLSLSLAMDMDVIPKVERENNNNRENEIAFRHKFGVSPMMADFVWKKLCDNGLKLRQKRAKQVHLLWALFFIYTYPKETVGCQMVSTTRNTYRKWVWIMIHEIELIFHKVVSITDL